VRRVRRRPDRLRTGCELGTRDLVLELQHGRAANGMRTGHSGFSTGTAARPNGPSVRLDGLRTGSEQPANGALGF
jgi:hypothetical protein